MSASLWYFSLNTSLSTNNLWLGGRISDSDNSSERQYTGMLHDFRFYVGKAASSATIASVAENAPSMSAAPPESPLPAADIHVVVRDGTGGARECSGW